jgi:hypothetical protein
MGGLVMTKEDILKIAQECNLIGMRPHLDGIYSESLETFAKLVAEKEREACAVFAEECVCGCGRSSCIDGDLRAHDIAESIRSRGDKND